MIEAKDAERAVDLLYQLQRAAERLDDAQGTAIFADIKALQSAILDSRVPDNVLKRLLPDAKRMTVAHYEEELGRLRMEIEGLGVRVSEEAIEKHVAQHRARQLEYEKKYRDGLLGQQIGGFQLDPRTLSQGQGVTR